MATNVQRMAFSASVLMLGLAAQMTSASAASIHPMTFDECSTSAVNGDMNCMYIEGGGDSAIEIRGWSEPGSAWIGYTMHEEVVEPDGDAYRNSATATITSPTQILSCHGGPENMAVGSWCSISWVYETNGENSEYSKAAENCGTVSV